ncbi:hypothetical protein SAMN05216275_14155 [Streptosporangium canum]|uniref:Uncharacterized protein n=1 Tax=Streptosporangium canum TaxID=324952 RepID=A0A1I4DFQ1_9ACTN|nr:hypothetical protein [Streptosporangium canum]SFK92458.1 hypothetical protein SAMN05216275_14155 [Streptosporangium canum]
MAVTAYVYGQLNKSLMSGLINFTSDTIKAMLLSAYTVGTTLDSAQFLNTVTAAGTEATGSGYTAGGATLASKTVTYTAANSWTTQRANSTAYTVGDVVRPATGNGLVYRCVVAGTTGGSIPTYTTVVGDDFTDGGVTWVAEGSGVLVVDAADPSWTTINPGTLAGSHVVFYKDTGTPATSPVIVLWDLGGTQTASNGGTFTATLDSTEGLLTMFTS